MNQLRKAKDPTKNAYKDEGLMGKLSEHLRQIGLDATLLPPESPEAIGSRWKKGSFVSGQSLGCIRIRKRNLDLIQVEKTRTEEPSFTGGPGGPGDLDLGRLVYLYHFIVRTDVEGLERALRANIKLITKGLLSRKIIDFEWKGRELARLLNLDYQLKNMLLKNRLDQLPTIEITADKANKCVRITRTPPIPKWTYGPTGREAASHLTVGREFPTREEFEAYDRIAHHIRNMRQTSSLVTR
jgi:hypothetical protein